MINLCIVGAGDVVQVRHAPILGAMNDKVRVAGVVSSRAEAVAEVERQLGYSVVRHVGIEDGLATSPDCLLIAVPALQTATVASAVVRRGLPLYIEKPLASDVITGAKLVEDVISQRIHVVIGENFSKQARFTAGVTLCSECENKRVRHLRVRDVLRRGARSVLRTDDELFTEHCVHIISACRRLTRSEIVSVKEASKATVGSTTEYQASFETENGASIDLNLCIANVWSDDRYLLSLDGADTCITHTIDFKTRKYTDVVSHYHGTDDLIKVMHIPEADCGIRICWEELLLRLETDSSEPSPSLINSLNDIQVREATLVAMRRETSVPIVPFKS